MDDDDLCGRGEDDHEVVVNIEFELTTDGDGDVSPAAAGIRSHIHNVPVDLAATTLVIVATKFLADHMAHDTFDGCPSHALAHTLANAAAKAYLIDTIKRLPESIDDIALVIPDDISSLLEGD